MSLKFCGPLTQTALTDNDLLSTYSSKNVKGLLGASGPSILGSIDITNQDRDGETGVIVATVLPGLVSSLQAKGVFPTPPSMTQNPNQDRIINAFMSAEATAIDNIKREYCFYASRYQYALNTLIEKLQKGYPSTNTDNKAMIDSKLNITIQLNRKLNDIIQIVNEFTKTRLAQSQTYNDNLNALNDSLMVKSKALAAQNTTLKSGQADALLYKEMVKYTREKTNYTNNMLMLYSFLNITALGLLFFAYQSFE
jgi:hypothetical protein